MTDLADLTEAFKREVAVPGSFTVMFPNVKDSDIEAALGDAFAQAQLDGYFKDMALAPVTFVVTPDLSVAGGALVVLYAGSRLIRQQLRGMASTSRYKAGPVEYETQTAVTLLTQELKALDARRLELIQNAIRAGRGAGTTFVLDAFAGRHRAYGGFFAYELAGAW